MSQKEKREMIKEEGKRLGKKVDLANQIVSAIRDKSIHRIKGGATSVFIAYPLAAHGGVVMI